jgi:hypothetical protein
MNQPLLYNVLEKWLSKDGTKEVWVVQEKNPTNKYSYGLSFPKLNEYMMGYTEIGAYSTLDRLKAANNEL